MMGKILKTLFYKRILTLLVFLEKYAQVYTRIYKLNDLSWPRPSKIYEKLFHTKKKNNTNFDMSENHPFPSKPYKPTP